MFDGITYIECDCRSDEHILRFILDKDDDYPCIYLHTFLPDQYWYHRLREGVKYIFGYKSKYGHFSETLINKEEEIKLKKLIEEFIE